MMTSLGWLLYEIVSSVLKITSNKEKVNLAPSLTKYYVVNTYGEWMYG
jgi:hypothetical protein